MGYRSLAQCVADLESSGRLVRITVPVDPYLEAATIHRRVNRAGGPALYFANLKGCRFPAVSNLFGTLERTRYLFRDTLDTVRKLVAARIDPRHLARRPWQALPLVPAAWSMVPKRVRTGQVLAHEITLGDLPRIVTWPRDGGPFITLPQVYTLDPARPGWRSSNLGMYRVQLCGNQYSAGREVGLHYQIHRGIGVHHAAAIAAGVPLRVSVWVGGPPALTVAAVMPLPEGLPEIAFAGALGGRRVPLATIAGLPPIHAQADFCIVGSIDPARQLPEGPFGDHLGYYSLVHDFPVMRVEKVFHRAGAIWPFTVVGRPPQEDTAFGQFIHELTGPVIPSVIPGVKAVHAVDAAGVHPLLLAIGSERYTPYAARRQPQELLTQANAILGQGQLSLAKYLWIAASEDDPSLDIHDVGAFLQHVLRRADWQRDLHFQTMTTIDTLDYSGHGLNQGSKLVVAAVGEPRRELPTSLPGGLDELAGFHNPKLALPGVVVIGGPPYGSSGPGAIEDWCWMADASQLWQRFPLVVVADDSEFAAKSLANLLWVTFTRSNPATDVYGVGAEVVDKHWRCRQTLVIDARTKPHHAPALEEDPEVLRRVDELAAQGGPLAGLW